MPTFRDSTGHEWNLRYDGLTLRAMREELKIDLADVTGATYSRLESDDAELTAAVCYLIRNELATAKQTKEQFASNLCGEALESAMSALWGAAKIFFRPKLWSVLQSNYDQRKAALATWDQVRPALAVLNQPDMPEAMREAVMGALAEKLRSMTAGGSELSPENLSVLGPDATLLNSVIASPDSVPSTPAA